MRQRLDALACALVPALLLLVAATACRPPLAQPQVDAALLERGRAMANELLLVDTHVDLPYRLEGEFSDVSIRRNEGHFDWARAREGGLDAPFMSIYIPAELQEKGGAKELAEKLITLVERIATTWPEKFALANSPAEVRAAAAAGKVALPLGMENAAPIDNLEDLRHFHARGIRYVTLAHSENNQHADSSYADQRQWNGLSPLGKEMVREMNRLGILVDLSHLSDAAVDQILEISTAPVIASHSSCRHFTPGWERNLDDERIQRLAAKGGVIQINFGAAFVDGEANRVSNQGWEELGRLLDAKGWKWSSPEAAETVKAFWSEHPIPPVPLARVADHVDHVVRLAGVDHVGFGSDFDGVEELPVGLEDVSKYPALLAELLRRGYSEKDLAKICGENLLRVWGEAERVAAR